MAAAEDEKKGLDQRGWHKPSVRGSHKYGWWPKGSPGRETQLKQFLEGASGVCEGGGRK